MATVTAFTVQDGSKTEWPETPAGAAFSTIDEDPATPDDADFFQAGANAQITFVRFAAPSEVAIPAGHIIAAISLRLRRSTPAGGGIDWLLREVASGASIGGMNFQTAANQALGNQTQATFWTPKVLSQRPELQVTAQTGATGARVTAAALDYITVPMGGKPLLGVG